MGYRHTKQEILDGALAAAFDDGLSQLTFGRVAKRLGVPKVRCVYRRTEAEAPARIDQSKKRDCGGENAKPKNCQAVEVS